MTYKKLTDKALHKATVACRVLVPASPREEADKAIHRIFGNCGHNIANLAFRSRNKCPDGCDWLGAAMACNVPKNPHAADIVHHFAVVRFEQLTGQTYTP